MTLDRYAASCPGWASQIVFMKKSCLACQGYPTCRGETTRPPELSAAPHINGCLNFTTTQPEKLAHPG